MENSDYTVFTLLYQESYRICFGRLMDTSLTETESKLFAQRIFESTGLTIGWRSLKNYSVSILSNDAAKKENPSIATLDTLARFVKSAPFTNEIARKRDENHHPYWFSYRAAASQINTTELIEAVAENKSKTKKSYPAFGGLVFTLCIVGIVIYFLNTSVQPHSFTDNFEHTSDSLLIANGWTLKDKNPAYWSKHQNKNSALTLYTIEGDNWPDTSFSTPRIQNLLLRALPFECFTAELQLSGFVPAAEWQQTGILLLQDTTLNSSSMRLSLGYNDYFGGYHRSNEIITQAVYSPGSKVKPEEIAHYPVLVIDSAVKISALFDNLKYSALRIEKQGNHYRFLYAGGLQPNTAFKEVAVKNISFTPKYIALFACKGYHTKAAVISAVIKQFSVQQLNCE